MKGPVLVWRRAGPFAVKVTCATGARYIGHVAKSSDLLQSNALLLVLSSDFYRHSSVFLKRDLEPVFAQKTLQDNVK